ncbi:MAG: hypothetical protein SFU86_08795 [Pirellulaceae bacterium]|nr:hypothetical protein [Pirellulaceae bacterium]
MNRHLLALACGLLALLATGCGPRNPPTYPVTGKVTLEDGTPLAGAQVEFEGKTPAGETINASGETGPDGVYMLTTFEKGDGAVAGEHRVIVAPPANVTPSNFSGPPPRDIIDRKFRSYESSGLSFTVQPPPAKNEYDITVQAPK